MHASPSSPRATPVCSRRRGWRKARARLHFSPAAGALVSIHGGGQQGRSFGGYGAAKSLGYLAAEVTERLERAADIDGVVARYAAQDAQRFR